jgi:photosystem II stability/assembly factor-like uncharacterized protein
MMSRRWVHIASSTTLISAALLSTAVTSALGAPALQPSLSAGTATPQSWQARSSGTARPLFAVSCFDALRCKAVGAGGTIRYTKDGGKTWRAQSNPLSGSSTTLYRISCLGRSTCYVIGRPNLVLVTHNGGVSWSVHVIPLSGVTSSLTDTACVSGQEGDLRTRPALCRLGLLDLACISTSTCYLIATPSAIYLTTDGGATWLQQAIPATSPCQGVCGATGFPYPLEWISCLGYFCRAGGSTFIGSHEGYASRVISAKSPGAPWTPAKNSYLRTSPDTVVCPSISRCYGVWSTSPFAPGNDVFLSKDGGGDWTRKSSGSSKIRNAIACPGARNCYTVGNQGTITASVDGSPFAAQKSSTSHDLYAITCVNLTTCFSVGTKGTIVSRTNP